MAFFTTTDELIKAGVAVNANFEIEPVLPYFDNAFEQLRPLLGDAFAQELLTQETSLPQPDTYLVIRPWLVQAVAKIGFADYMPFAEVQIAGDGITVSAVQGRKAAAERQVLNLRSTLLESGWMHVETLLRYLDSQAEVDYPLYEDHISQQTPTLLPSTEQFSRFYSIGRSRLTYEALRPTITRLEADTLIPYLADRWARLTAVPAPFDLTIEEATLQRHLRAWLAFQTIVEAVPSLLVRVQGQGVRVIWGTATATGSVEYFTPATDAQLTRLLNHCTQQADNAWQAALKLMTPPTEEAGRGLIDNSDSSLFFI